MGLVPFEWASLSLWERAAVLGAAVLAVLVLAWLLSHACGLLVSLAMRLMLRKRGVALSISSLTPFPFRLKRVSLSFGVEQQNFFFFFFFFFFSKKRLCLVPVFSSSFHEASFCFIEQIDDFDSFSAVFAFSGPVSFGVDCSRGGGGARQSAQTRSVVCRFSSS